MLHFPSPEIFTKVINSYFPEPHSSLLRGLILGINLRTSKRFYNSLKTIGLLHLVVLSGTNITMLIAIIANLTKFISKKLSILLTILTIVLFVVFVGPQAPIVRAAFVGSLTLVSIILGKKTEALYLLFLSAVFCFLFRPIWIKGISFQLSYSATLGIILFGSVDEKKSNNFFKAMKQNLWKELKPSLSAEIFTIPIIFIYFKQISLISPLANLLAAPIITPIMIFGFLTIILGKVNYFLGLPFSIISFGMLHYLVIIIGYLSKIPNIFIQF